LFQIRIFSALLVLLLGAVFLAGISAFVSLAFAAILAGLAAFVAFLLVAGAIATVRAGTDSHGEGNDDNEQLFHVLIMFVLKDATIIAQLRHFASALPAEPLLDAQEQVLFRRWSWGWSSCF